jgi:peptide/nickel transport system substrate-binding protein
VVGGNHRKVRHVAAAVAAIGLVAAACGGGGSKKPTATATSSTTETAPSESSTSTSVAVAEGATSTTLVGGVTATTARTSGAAASTSKTTAKRATTATTGLTIGRAPAGGISNVTAAPTTAPRQDIQPGGTLTVLKAGEIAGFDPPRVTNSGANDGPANSAIYDVLFYSQGGSVKPQTAESLTSADGLVWTLKLHPGIRFTDGTAYDAAAVKFNWARIQDPANAAIRAAQANLIQSMDVVDAVTLRITLKQKNALFPGAAATIPFVASPAAIQAKGAAAYNSDPVGAGPFTLKSWTRDSTMTLVRNPNYWNAPRPYIDQLVFKVIIDESQRINTLKTGDANMSFISTPASAAQTQKDGSVPYVVALNGGFVMNFNTTKAPFNDIRARQAVSIALDLADLTKVTDGGVFDPLDSIFLHSSPFFDAGIAQQKFDATKAQQLFDQLATETGGPLKFTMSTFPATNFQVQATYIQAALNKYRNVQVNLVTESSQAHQTSCNTRSFDGICHTALPFDDPDPAWVNSLVCNAPISPTGWCDPKFDADVADNRVTLDANQRIADIKDAQKEFYAQMPAFFVDRLNSWWSAVPTLQDLTLVNDGLFLSDRVWFKTH